MNFFFETLFLFLTFSFVGWIIEVIFRGILYRKIINPGFMTGFTLPIYGFGGIILIFISRVVDSINTDYKYLIVFLLSAIIMTTVEYIGGNFFIKYYKIKLWDYSKERFNYKGIICPSFTIIWGAFGVLFYTVIYNKIYSITSIFLSNNYYIFMFGVFFGIFLIDLFFSLNLLKVLKRYGNFIKEIISFEGLKLKLFTENKRIIFLPNFKLMGYIKEKLIDIGFLKRGKDE